MRAKVLKINYEPPSFCVTNGHKSGERMRWVDGVRITPTGYGWAQESSGTRLILECDVDGERCELWVEKTFRERGWVRLTNKRVQAIISSCPVELDVETAESRAGNQYYRITEKAGDAWFRAAKKIALYS